MQKPSQSMLRILLLSLAALFLASPVLLFGWCYDPSGITPQYSSIFQPGTRQVTNSRQAILEGRAYCLEVDDSAAVLSACDGSTVIPSWQSPESWQVQEGFFADLNRDGTTEAVLLVRRPFAPWPIDRFLPSGGRIAEFHDKAGYSLHVILITLRENEFKEAWAGSALVQPIRQLSAADLDGDGYEELAALEYQYDLSPRKAALVVWHWNGFGFSLGARQPGNFSTLNVLNNQQGTWLVTN